MSTHIKMDDEYSEVSTYYGSLDDKYQFTVEVSYNSEIGNHNITSIEFIGDTEHFFGKSEQYFKKAEDKIKDFVMKWLFEKPKNQVEMEDE